MNIRQLVTTGTVSLVLIGTGLALAQGPPGGIDPRRNPNLAAAQRYVDQAYQKLTDAQKANEFDLNGHAQRAKELLDQANQEIKKAAFTADHK